MKTQQLIALALSVFAMAGLPARAETTKPLVAVIAPMSGPLAFMGDGLRKGMLLNTDFVRDYEVIFEDNRGNGAEAVSAWRKITDVQHPALVIAAETGAVLAPLATPGGTPLLLTISSASALADSSKGTFRYFTNADVDAPVIAEHAYKSRGFRKMAIVHLQDQFSADYARVFADTFTRLGGTIVTQESFNYPDNDFRAQLLRVRNSSPDAIYLVGLDYQLTGLVAQAKQMGLKQPLLAIGTIASRDAIQKANGLFEGVEVTAFCTDGPNPAFVDRFRKDYGTFPDFFSELGADLAAIVMKAKGRDAGSFTQGLRSLGTMELNAGKVTEAPSGEIAIPACVKKITNGKILNLQTGRYSEY